MTEKFLSKIQVENIKTHLRDWLKDALVEKGHTVEFIQSYHPFTVDGHHIDLEFRHWGEPAYRSWHPAGYNADDHYAKAVEVILDSGSRSRYSKTKRRTNADGQMPEVSIMELVLEIENIVNSKNASAKYKVEAEQGKAGTIAFLAGLGMEPKYGDCRLDESYSSNLKLHDDGSVEVKVTCRANEHEKMQQIIEFIRKLNLDAAHEAGLADSEAA